MYLPKSIGNLTKLEYLDIINNRISELPETIGNLSGLKYNIYAYENPLTQLPTSIYNLPVKILY